VRAPSDLLSEFERAREDAGRTAEAGSEPAAVSTSSPARTPAAAASFDGRSGEERHTSGDRPQANERRLVDEASESAGIQAGGLDAFAERAVRVRAAAVVTGSLLARLSELANLAEDGVRDPQPAQALAVVAASLLQAVVEAGALETRLARTGEEQIEAVLALQIVPIKPTLRSLARYARELARRLGRQIEV